MIRIFVEQESIKRNKVGVPVGDGAAVVVEDKSLAPNPTRVLYKEAEVLCPNCGCMAGAVRADMHQTPSVWIESYGPVDGVVDRAGVKRRVG